VDNRAVAQLRARIASALLARVSPERTRRATLFERLTVRRMSWELVERCNRYLELLGKLTTAIWVAFLASFVFGIDWREVARTR
jgi:hypothetical protein